MKGRGFSRAVTWTSQDCHPEEAFRPTRDLRFRRAARRFFTSLALQVLRATHAWDRAAENHPARACEAGDLTAGETPVPIPNTEVKPRRADCTARESVWESRSLPALIKATFRNECGLFLFSAGRYASGGDRPWLILTGRNARRWKAFPAK